jgi:hypothetical protein
MKGTESLSWKLKNWGIERIYSKAVLIQAVVWRDWSKAESILMRTNIFHENQKHSRSEGEEVTLHTAKESRQRLRQEYWENKEVEKHGLKEKNKK